MLGRHRCHYLRRSGQKVWKKPGGLLQKLEFSSREPEVLQVEVAKRAFQFATSINERNTVVADHNALVRVAVEACIFRGVVAEEEAIAQHELTEADLERDHLQKCWPDLPQFVVKEDVMEAPVKKRISGGVSVRDAFVQIFDSSRGSA